MSLMHWLKNKFRPEFSSHSRPTGTAVAFLPITSNWCLLVLDPSANGNNLSTLSRPLKLVKMLSTFLLFFSSPKRTSPTSPVYPHSWYFSPRNQFVTNPFCTLSNSLATFLKYELSWLLLRRGFLKVKNLTPTCNVHTLGVIF